MDKWQGKFRDDYLEFFIPNENSDSSKAFIKEAERYRKKGTFAGLLGDSMPLALANVLKIPLMILSAEHNVPFIDICPRTVLTGANAIFLAHYSAEAGHYNALIPLNQTTGYQDRQTIPETSSPSTTTVDVDTSDKLSCRCNSAKRKKSANYTARCDCIKVAGSCQQTCKCDGKCGDSVCRQIGDNKENGLNQNIKKNSRKRVRQEYQKFSPQKGKDFLSTRSENICNGPLNLAEHFLLRAIINYLIGEKDSNLSSHAGNFYNAAIEIIRKDAELDKLPISGYSNQRIKKEIRKILLNDDKLDQFK